MSDEREYTVLICPECGKQSNFSAMDAVHGGEARCYSHGLEEVEDEHGTYTRVKPGPELVALVVVPRSSRGSGSAASSSPSRRPWVGQTGSTWAMRTTSGLRPSS